MAAELAGEEVLLRRRWPRVLAVLALLLGLALLALWLARKPIAQGQVDRFLTEAKVPVRYTIADLGLGRQRLTNVVLGDPARPDLVADWLETRTAWGLRGPYLAGVRGGRVRVRARWADGRLSLGSIDRLLPKGEAGKPFALPALALDMADLRARVETPWGLVGAKLAGSGRLDGGFDGRLAVTSQRLAQGDCAATQPEGVWQVRTVGAGLAGPARVTLDGSTQAEGLACAGVATGFTNANGMALLNPGDRLSWSMTQDLAATALRHPRAQAGALSGRLELQGGPKVTGSVALAARGVAARGLSAGRLTLTGDVVRDQARQVGFAFDGKVGWSDATAALPALNGLEAAGEGTPLYPLLRRAMPALRAAVRRFAGEAAVNVTTGPLGLSARLSRATLTSVSGARGRYEGAPRAAWSGGVLVVNGTAAFEGGGLPTMAVRFDERPNAIGGTATLLPYAINGARLALWPVVFSDAGGDWRVTTRAELSGPLGDGRVERLALPIDARWRNGALTLGGGCVPVSWAGIAVSGLRLDPGALRLCPKGEALVRYGGGRLTGGARIAAARLTGRLGATPLTLAVADARVRLADRGFALHQVEARLGAPGREVLLAAGSLDGRIGADGLAGRFADTAGRIGAVPLALSGAAGDWRLADGVLTLTAGLTVADTAATPRFRPLAVRAAALRLAEGRITATGALHEPTTGAQVADVAIRHDLSAGQGVAELTVAGLAFANGFQPNQLTPLTFGVIADVRGTVTGEARIGWGPAGVTSTGAFRTAGTDLAAAFGPVQGLAGEIRFTDLLALQSAPGQRVTVKSINPGVPVTNGVVTFRTLPGTRVQVEDGRWPFAGGTLTLDPTLLDFAGPAERRLTFRVTGAAADKFLQSFDFRNLNATGTFDGVLPMVFDAGGGRIADGRLTVRPGGGTIAYVGDISQKNLGFWGNFAFDTLKSLRYRSLGVVMNGPLAGEMVTEVRFAGISQGEGAKSNFIIRRLQRLPVVFNIRIRAPFRGLLDATASFYDPKRLIERNLPELIRQQNAIQPPASETVP